MNSLAYCLILATLAVDVFKATDTKVNIRPLIWLFALIRLLIFRIKTNLAQEITGLM